MTNRSRAIRGRRDVSPRQGGRSRGRPSDRETTAIAAKLPSWALPQIPEAAKLCIIAARPGYRSANIRAPCHQIDDGVRVKASQRVSNVLLRLLVCSFGEGKTGGPKTPHPRHVTLGFEERRV